MVNYNHLFITPEWMKEYHTKYPHGYSVMENLIDWVTQVNALIDWANITPEKALEIMNGWKADGTFDSIIYNVLNDIDVTVDQATAKANEALSKALIHEYQIQTLASGSPKGVYDTLPSLAAAYPSGNTGLYITMDNGNWNFWNGSSWVPGGVYQAAGIADGSVSVEKLQSASLFKNLFNMGTALANMYIDYTTGTVQAAAGYMASDFIPVVPGNTYTKNRENQIAFYNSSKVFVSGLGDGTFTFTVPAGCYFLRATLPSGDLYGYQIESGSKITNTTEYQKVIETVILPRKDNLYDVAKKGGNFSSINDGIYYTMLIAPVDDITLRINPGTYEEVVTLLKGDKKVSLVGMNKRDCIIINKSGDYYYSPLQAAGRNYFKNLSFIANHDNVGVIPYPSAYAMHSDYNFPGEMIFEDCNFESMQNAAAGIGMFADQTMIFRNCRFYSESVYDGGAFYMHNAVASGAANQKMILINCEILSASGHALKIDDANIGSGDGLGNDCEITFINCNVYSNQLGADCVDFNTPATGVKKLAGNIKLGPRSSGNNLSILNY